MDGSGKSEDRPAGDEWPPSIIPSALTLLESSLWSSRLGGAVRCSWNSGLVHVVSSSNLLVTGCGMRWQSKLFSKGGTGDTTVCRTSGESGRQPTSFPGKRTVGELGGGMGDSESSLSEPETETEGL